MLYVYIYAQVEDLRVREELAARPEWTLALRDLAEGRGVAAGNGGSDPACPSSSTSAAGLSAFTAADVVQGSGRGEGLEDEGPAAVATAAEVSCAAEAVARAPPRGAAGRTVRILQSHGDQVLELPPGATCLADSDTARYEIWGVGDRVLAWQGHPELTRRSVLEKIYPFIVSAGRVTGAAAEEAKRKIESAPLDDAFLLRVGWNFVRGVGSPLGRE
jgi:hypothetical protein